MSMRQLKYLKLNKIKNNIKIALACAKVLSSLCIIISFSLYFLPWNKNFQNTYWLLTNIFYFQTIDYIYTIFPILSLPSIISLGIFAWKKVSFWAEYLFIFFFLPFSCKDNDFHNCEIPKRGSFLQVVNNTRYTCDKVS